MHVDAGKHARLRNDDLDRRVAGKRVLGGKGVVVPHHDDGRGALGQRAGLADDGNEVAGLVEFGKELEALFACCLAGSRAAGEAGREHAEDCLVGGARIAGEGDLAGIFRLEKVRPVSRRIGNQILVHDQGHHAVIVAVPVAFGILGTVRDRIPGRYLVGLDQAFGLGGRAEGETDVDDVGRLRALVVLVRLDRLDLVGRAGIRVQLVDRDFRVLGLEAGNDVAVAAPVMRQRDGRQLAFRLGSGNEFVHGLCRSKGRRQHERRRRKGKQLSRELEHSVSPLN